MERKLKKVATSPNPYNKQRDEAEREAALSLKRERDFLVKKVGRNALAKSYYSHLTDTLYELLMLELAQRAAEVSAKFETRNRIIRVTDESLKPFREEMNKVKYLKLVTATLEIAGVIPIEEALSHVVHSLYGVKGQEKKENPSESIRRILDEYIKKLEASNSKFQKEVIRKVNPGG